MLIPQEIIFGISAAFFFGLADILIKKSAEKTGPFTAVRITLFVSVVLILAYSLLFETTPSFTLNSLFFSVLAGIAGAIAWITFFRAFSVGDVSVIVPVTASWGVIPFILALLILSEKLTVHQGISSFLIFAGVLLVSVQWGTLRQFGGKKFREGAALALLAMVAFGLVGFLLKFAVDSLGIFYSLIVYRTITLVILLPMGWRERKAGLAHMPLLIGIGALEALGNVSFTTGLSKGLVSLVSAAISTETIIAVVLAYLFFKERLRPTQIVGIVAVVAGLSGLSLSS